MIYNKNDLTIISEILKRCVQINQHVFYLQIDDHFMPPNILYDFFSVIYYNTVLN